MTLLACMTHGCAFCPAVMSVKVMGEATGGNLLDMPGNYAASVSVRVSLCPGLVHVGYL